MAKFKPGDIIRSKEFHVTSRVLGIIDAGPSKGEYALEDEYGRLDYWFGDYIDEDHYLIFNFNKMWRDLNA